MVESMQASPIVYKLLDPESIHWKPKPAEAMRRSHLLGVGCPWVVLDWYNTLQPWTPSNRRLGFPSVGIPQQPNFFGNPQSWRV